MVQLDRGNWDLKPKEILPVSSKPDALLRHLLSMFDYILISRVFSQAVWYPYFTISFDIEHRGKVCRCVEVHG